MTSERRIARRRAELWIAWLSWGALIVTIAVLILRGSDHTVVSAYRDAAVQWFAGRDIYSSTGHGFLYLPSAAILFAPFAALPMAASEIAWRVLTIGSFAVGIRRLSTLAGRGLSVDLFPLMTLAALPPALSCARNGQSTLIMTATMLLAVVELATVDCVPVHSAAQPADARRKSARLWLATLWLSLSLAFKPLALAMVLLVGALDRRMAWRLGLGVAIVLGFPFFFQSPPYVVAQYVKSLEMFRASSHCGMIELWAQPFSALGLLGVNISEGAQTLVRLAAALVTLFLCRQAQRRHAAPRAMESLFSFSVLYILLFNPRTENNTYAMLGPAIGLFAARWIGLSRHRAATVFFSLLLLLLAAGDELVRATSPPGEHIWLKPCLAILFLAYLVFHLFARHEDAQEEGAETTGRSRGSVSTYTGKPLLAPVGAARREGASLS